MLNGVTYDVSQVSPFGTLFVNSATGAYAFVPDNDAINALTEPTAANFTVTVSDGTLSANQTFTIAINGTNDAAVISGDHNRLGDRGRQRRQCLVRPADRYRHADRTPTSTTRPTPSRRSIRRRQAMPATAPSP